MRFSIGVLKMLVVISSPAHCTVQGVATCMETSLGRPYFFQSIRYGMCAQACAILESNDSSLRVAKVTTTNNGDCRSRIFDAPIIRLCANSIPLSSMCHPCRGFMFAFEPFSHRCRGGLRCGVPP